MHQYPPTDSASYFFRFNSNMLLDRSYLSAKAIASFVDQYVPAGNVDKKAQTFTLHQIVCTVNVNTLSDPTKRATYEDQYRKYKVSIIAKQETKCTQTGVRDFGPFVACSSSAYKGQVECDLLFNKSIPVGKYVGNEVYCKSSMMDIQIGEPRLLVVEVTSRVSQCICIDIHSFIPC